MRMFLNSTVVGKLFSVSIYKPDCCVAYASAVEGVLGNDGSSFTTELYGDDRIHHHNLIGNNTEKNRNRALSNLITDLEDLGYVPLGQYIELPATKKYPQGLRIFGSRGYTVTGTYKSKPLTESQKRCLDGI